MEVNVRAIRRKLGLSQSAFAAAFGLNQVTISRWETGNRHLTITGKILMLVIKHNPEVVQKVLAEEQPEFFT